MLKLKSLAPNFRLSIIHTTILASPTINISCISFKIMIPYFIQQWCHSDICEGLEFTQLSKTFAWPHHQTKMYMYVRDIEYVSLFSIYQMNFWTVMTVWYFLLLFLFFLFCCMLKIIRNQTFHICDLKLQVKI